MNNEMAGQSGLLRLTGFMGVGVGLAWALQLLGYGRSAATFSQLMWMLGAAVIAGAGTGIIYASASLREAPSAARIAPRA